MTFTDHKLHSNKLPINISPFLQLNCKSSQFDIHVSTFIKTITEIFEMKFVLSHCQEYTKCHVVVWNFHSCTKFAQNIQRTTQQPTGMCSELLNKKESCRAYLFLVVTSRTSSQTKFDLNDWKYYLSAFDSPAHPTTLQAKIK